MKITVSRNEILASLLFAGKDKSRFVLGSVLIEYKKGKRPLLVTTDGRRLAIIRSMAGQEVLSESGMFPVSADFLKAACEISRIAGGRLEKKIELEIIEHDVTAKVQSGICCASIKDRAIVGGTYPNWRQALPKKSENPKPVSELSFQPAYVADYQKAADLLSIRGDGIRFSFAEKGSPIEVRIGNFGEFYGCMIPMKLEEIGEYKPMFLTEE